METLSSTAVYQYDADGIRVAQDVDGVQTVFIVDKNRDYAQVFEERDNFGDLTVSYVHGDDLISQNRAGNVSYYHMDGLGSTRALTDDTETVTDTYNYEAFGNIIQQTGTTENTYLFTGESLDPNSGFIYLRARYYYPEISRFVTTDPFAGKPSEPMSLHKYMYANMNPVIFVDPSGEFSLNRVMVGVGIGSILLRESINIYANFISKKKPIKWTGRLLFMGTNLPLGKKSIYEYAYLMTRQSTTTPEGYTVSHSYEIILIGFSLPRGYGDLSISELNMKTPGLFGYDKQVMEGLSYFIGGSYTKYGFGGGVCRMVMGLGTAKGPSWVVGYDKDIDGLIGWSNNIGS